MELLKNSFRPEFLNRIDEIIIFKALSAKELEQIVLLLLEKTRRLLHAQKFSFLITPSAVAELSRLGYDPQFGARPLSRIIQKEIENTLSNKILKGEYQEGDEIKVDFDGRFKFSK
jgi:ATP-dependent Clp protease ATP-binding subunit ClpC